MTSVRFSALATAGAVVAWAVPSARRTPVADVVGEDAPPR
jgi:hypothetical protein